MSITYPDYTVAAHTLTVETGASEEVQRVVNGHPSIVTIRAVINAQEIDTALVTVGAGSIAAVTRCSVKAHPDNPINVSYVIGFGAATTPTTIGVISSHPGLPAGLSDHEGDGSGLLGKGTDGQDIRITTGSFGSPPDCVLEVLLSYYLIPTT